MKDTGALIMLSSKRKISGKIAAILIIGIAALSGCKGSLPTVTSDTEHPIPKDESMVPRISAEDLKHRLDAGEKILVVDVRSTNAYNTQHIAGALSVPLKEVESRLDEFQRDQEIVFYCA